MSELAIDDEFKKRMMKKYEVSEEEYDALMKAANEPKMERGLQLLATMIEIRRKRLETST